MPGQCWAEIQLSSQSLLVFALRYKFVPLPVIPTSTWSPSPLKLSGVSLSGYGWFGGISIGTIPYLLEVEWLMAPRSPGEWSRQAVEAAGRGGAAVDAVAQKPEDRNWFRILPKPPNFDPRSREEEISQ